LLHSPIFECAVAARPEIGLGKGCKDGIVDDPVNQALPAKHPDQDRVVGSDPRKLPGRVSTFGCNSYDIGYILDISFSKRGVAMERRRRRERRRE